MFSLFPIILSMLSIPLYCGPSIVNFSAGINYLQNRPDFADIQFAYQWLDRQNSLKNGMTTHEMIMTVAQQSDKLIAYREKKNCEELPGSHPVKLNRNIMVVTTDNRDINAFCGSYATAMCRVNRVESFPYNRLKAQRMGYTQVIYVGNIIRKIETF